MKRFLVLVCLFLFFTACGGNVESIPELTTDSLEHLSHEADEVPEAPRQEEVVFPTGELEDHFENFVDPDNIFELTNEQHALFEEYSRDFNFDISIFQGVNPVDVAQVFIECGINGLWEGEYNLFYFEFDYISKEEFYRGFVHDMATQDIRMRRSLANISFPNLNDGTFVDLGNGSGYIEFLSVDAEFGQVHYETMLRLYMRHVDDVWLINQSRFLQSAEED